MPFRIEGSRSLLIFPSKLLVEPFGIPSGANTTCGTPSFSAERIILVDLPRILRGFKFADDFLSNENTWIWQLSLRCLVKRSICTPASPASAERIICSGSPLVRIRWLPQLSIQSYRSRLYLMLSFRLKVPILLGSSLCFLQLVFTRATSSSQR